MSEPLQNVEYQLFTSLYWELEGDLKLEEKADWCHIDESMITESFCQVDQSVCL
jgi:hypothetical protein